MFIDTIWIIKVNKLRTFVVQKQGQMISTTARVFLPRQQFNMDGGRTDELRIN